MSISLSAIILIFLISISHPASSQLHCSNQTCGNLTVSYPFRLTSMPICPSFSSFFELECNNTSGKLYFNNASDLAGNPMRLQVIEIQNGALFVDITSLKSVLSTNQSAHSISCINPLNVSSIVLPSFPGPYFISDDNQFVSFGLCTMGLLTIAKFYNDYTLNYSHFEIGGCPPGDAICGNHTSLLPPGSSPRFADYSVEVYYLSNSTSCSSPCSSNYANLFHPSFSNFEDELYRLKLNWALPSNQTTNTTAIKESSDCACSRNSNLTVVDGVPGYLCSCNPGYNGDGYSNGSGCADINECDPNSQNNCILGRATCQNIPGNYTCNCNSRFYVGDGLTNGSGCRFSSTLRNAFVISGGILGLILLRGGIFFLAIWWRQRIKRKYFIQNGGLQLQAYIASRGRDTIRLFSAKELKAATNNYSNEMKLGVGGFGTVFKGMLKDGRIVAIKKANRDGIGDNEQFLNEIAILMQINHRHIVRLLGCCLETTTPLLVYDYVSNGNVAENLESKGVACVMGWEQRLKVAMQTTMALAYLHAAASPPILHRDVKPANVLLDDNMDVKVADFGVSRLVPEGVEYVTTAVHGTLGYLDPEYFQTLQLTDKSDVYSLGVMLVQLITGLKAVDNQREDPRFGNLALLFIEHMREGTCDKLIDPRLVESPSILHTHSSIMAVATLAHRCLSLVGSDRPSMSHIADELQHIKHSLHVSNEDNDETLPVLSFDDDHEAAAVVE